MIVCTKDAYSSIVKVSIEDSIQYAINNASDGDIIILSAGTFQERVVIDKSLTLRGSGIEKTRWDFIKKKGGVDDEVEPGGIKVLNSKESKVDIKLVIENIHLHSVRDLNAININKKEMKKLATLNIKNCKFTSDEGTWAVIFAQKSDISVKDSTFNNLNTTGILAESGCNVKLDSVHFSGNGGKYPVLFLGKSSADIMNCNFTNISGTSIAVTGNGSGLSLNKCEFNNSGKRGYPSLLITDYGVGNVVDSSFVQNNSTAIRVENRGAFTVNGKCEFSGKLKMNEPLVEIKNAKATITGGDLDVKSQFNNIESYGIVVDGGKLDISSYKFAGSPLKAQFVKCLKGSITIKNCVFGKSKSSIVMKEAKLVNLEKCDFDISSSSSLSIEKTKPINSVKIIDCDFNGANESCATIKQKSVVYFERCSFHGDTLQNPCVNVLDDCKTTVINCDFENINKSCLKAKNRCDITIKNCRFHDKGNGVDYSIQCEEKTRVNISGSEFKQLNNKIFASKNCTEVLFGGGDQQ